MGQLSSVKLIGTSTHASHGLVAMTRGDKAPALDGFQRGIVETGRPAARAQFDGLGETVRSDEHMEQHAALFAAATGDRRIRAVPDCREYAALKLGGIDGHRGGSGGRLLSVGNGFTIREWALQWAPEFPR